MAPDRKGSGALRRAAATAVSALLLLSTLTGSAAADITVTIGSQTPNPVYRGSTATYTVSVHNTSTDGHAFAVTGVIGAAGLSVSSSCLAIDGSGDGNFTASIGTSTSTPTGPSSLTFTVTAYASSTSCSGVVAYTDATGNAGLVVVLRPLDVTLYKEICPSYYDVPDSVSDGLPDDTGGNYVFEAHGYTTRPITFDNSNSNPPVCQPVAGWSFEFITGDKGTHVGDAGPTGADGEVTVRLDDEMLAWARSSHGVWVREYYQSPGSPDAASFGAIRCYNDAINNDNEEQITNVDDSTGHVYCIAFNVATPALTLTKTADPTTFSAAGQTIDYTYTLSNDSHAPVFGPFSVTDDKAAIVTCPATPTSLYPGDPPITCTATYTITAADVAAGSVTNTATAHANFASSTIDSNTDSATVTLSPVPALGLVKTADPTSFTAAGQTITYTYKITNSGNVPVSGFTVTDSLIAAVDCSTATSPLAVGASTTCSATYKTTAADVSAGSVYNTATAAGTYAGNPLTSNESDATVTLSPVPALGLVKTADPTSFTAAGQTITYTYKITNSGNVPVSGFTVTDSLIAAVDCSTATSPLAVGASTTCSATYKTTAADVSAGSVYNTATAAGTYAGNPLTSNESDATVTLSPVPALGLVKTADPTSFTAAGQTITYTYKITNSGNVPVSGFTVTDSLIAAVDCSTATSPLAVGASTTCSATYKTTAADVSAGSVYNTATAAGTYAGNPLTSNESDATVTLSPVPALGLVKTADPTSFTAAGQTITYTYKITNSGNVPVSGFTVTDSLIAAVDCSTATSPLAVGASTTCSATYKTTAADVSAGSVYNTATAAGTYAGNPLTSNESDATVTLSPVPALGLVKTADPTSFTAAGQTITYTYKITNSGNVPVSGFTVTDSLIAAVDCSTATSPLAVGASTTCSATYKTTAADVSAGSVYNTATAAGTYAGNPLTSNESDATVTLSPVPALGLVKTADPTSFTAAGQTITYTYKITNSGNVPVSGFTVTDSLIAAVDCSTATSPLAVGASTTCSATYKTTAADVSAGSVYNTATAAGTYAGNPLTSNESDATVTLSPVPALGLVKTADPTGFTAAGQTITYTYKITNSGNVPVSGFTVTDSLIAAVDCSTATSPLAVGASTTCSATYKTTAADVSAGSVYNTATAAGTYAGNPLTSNESDATVTLSPVPALGLVKTADPTSFTAAGQTITYTYKITNSGNVPVSGFTVTDSLIAAVDCSTATSPLAVGASTTCSATYKTTAADVSAGSVYNTATAAGTYAGNPLTSNESDATVTLSPVPALGLVKTADPTSFTAAGQTITYTYKITNSGNVPVSGFTVTDSLIAAVDCSTATSPLAVGASTTCSATYKTTAADVSAGSVYNTATAAGTYAGNPLTSNESDATVTLSPVPALGLVKTADPTSFTAAGQTITYTYKITNSGNVPVSGFTVTDSLIAAVDCSTATSPLAVGASTTCSATYKTTAADVSAGSVYNTATAAGTYAGNPLTSNESDATVTLSPVPALGLVKTADPTSSPPPVRPSPTPTRSPTPATSRSVASPSPTA